MSVAFYVWGGILGILLISQFWTLANGIYDPRQAKRLFGFIGGGVMLGGMTGALLTATIIEIGRRQHLVAVERGDAPRLHGDRLDRARARDKGRGSRGGRRRRAWRQPRSRIRAAPRVAADSADRGRDQFRVPRRAADRPAGEHGGRGLQGRRAGRFDRRFPRADPLLHLARRVRDPGLDHAAHPSIPRHRLRPPHPADQSRRRLRRSSC